jgi:oligopeptide/dipeptide ABC transporter ATP-binding protein
MRDGALLDVADLRVEYGDRAVVRDVSFRIARGRCLGIIGESGAGKSQVFLALLGLLPTRARVSGSARLGDTALLGGGATSVRGRRIAMIFQDPVTALTPHLTIGRQIAEPLIEHRGMSAREAEKQAGLLLDQVRMTDVPRRLKQYPHELSGGMRQRAMIAGALASDPELLVADEPTTALDVSVQAQILVLLRQLIAERDLSLAVVTHDMGVIAALADDVAVMRDGVIVERGAVRDVLREPRHDYTRSLLAATPRIDEPVATGGRVATAGSPPLVVRHVAVRHEIRTGGFRRASLTAVDDVSFEVAAGEALGIVGESGCGKSSLARALLKLGPTTAGDIVWLGENVSALETAALRPLRAGVQIVFQDPLASLDPAMTVGDIVAEPLRALRPELSAADRAGRVSRLLGKVGLSAEFGSRRSRELSGGQCQRVAIARAMILEPKLLVCDEAVSALDVSIQAQVLELIADFKRAGTAVVFVSHNLAVVRRLCERVLVMYLGRIVEAGPVAEVFATPRHPYTRLLLESVPRLDPDAARAQLASPVLAGDPAAEPPSGLHRPSGCAFRPRCPASRPACAERRPETEEAGKSREVACWRWRDLAT